MFFVVVFLLFFFTNQLICLYLVFKYFNFPDSWQVLHIMKFYVLPVCTNALTYFFIIQKYFLKIDKSRCISVNVYLHRKICVLTATLAV